MTDVLVAVALLANGLTAGIMLSTVLGIVPLTFVLPYRQYVQTIQFLWPRYDPFMPIVHVLTVLADLVLTLTVDAGPARVLFGLAGGLLVVVMAVSVVRNVPMNRFVMALDPASQPADWARVDPRPRWRAWNQFRTGLALLALLLNAAAAALS
ncbi:anthrone oxygenase family protein [Plantactinospora siamensis]|uniref:Anthrone oxygenase family protein n=1 Tax=Plantactinospora siamensis TaxID=555372 RepID=A0ABV6NWN9_9ACTN